ncbi:hypothetical protein GOV07_02880 [Candidatus Woesearchaeota archaeon]|nr:hypothetical protein [Candidatus Woesearchaeota archaeon]
MKLHHHKLRAKGWSETEIKHAQRALNRAEKKKHPVYKFLEVAVFWALLFLTAIGIFLTSIVITPLLIVLPQWLIITILVILGLCLGSLFAILIPDIEWLERKHHIFNFIFLTVLSIFNIWLITRVLANIPFVNPFLLGGAFALALLTPYIFHLIGETARTVH